jgi:hypothetical protein
VLGWNYSRQADWRSCLYLGATFVSGHYLTGWIRPKTWYDALPIITLPSDSGGVGTGVITCGLSGECCGAESLQLYLGLSVVQILFPTCSARMTFTSPLRSVWSYCTRPSADFKIHLHTHRRRLESLARYRPRLHLCSLMA